MYRFQVVRFFCINCCLGALSQSSQGREAWRAQFRTAAAVNDDCREKRLGLTQDVL